MLKNAGKSFRVGTNYMCMYRVSCNNPTKSNNLDILVYYSSAHGHPICRRCAKVLLIYSADHQFCALSLTFHWSQLYKRTEWTTFGGLQVTFKNIQNLESIVTCVLSQRYYISVKSKRLIGGTTTNAVGGHGLQFAVDQDWYANLH